jgi:segregation and condensation protein B
MFRRSKNRDDAPTDEEVAAPGEPVDGDVQALADEVAPEGEGADDTVAEADEAEAEADDEGAMEAEALADGEPVLGAEPVGDEAFDVVAQAEAELFGRAINDVSSDDAVAELRAAIEAICMVADQPVPSQLLADVLDVSEAKVDEICAELAREYQQQRRGFVLQNVAGGYRFQSHPNMATRVERFVLDGQSAKLSGAALETLAIVAYKQPLSRAQISAIRGVNVDGVLKTLQQRGYVTELGQDPGPGQAILFGTTSLFLEKLGIAALTDLPPLGDFIPDVELVEALEQTLRPSGIDVRDDEADDAGVVDDEPSMIDLRDGEVADDEDDDEPEVIEAVAEPEAPAGATDGAEPDGVEAVDVENASPSDSGRAQRLSVSGDDGG